jgi:hypothetical protein
LNYGNISFAKIIVIEKSVSMKTGLTVRVITRTVVSLSGERFHDVSEDVKLSGNSNDSSCANISNRAESDWKALLKL